MEQFQILVELFLHNLCNQICNMITRQDIEDFYRDVERLKTEIKHFGAEVAKATGYSKGNVSQYLKGGASEAFIKKFYEAFPKSSNDVQTPIATKGDGHAEHLLSTQVIFNLSESARDHAKADKLRADAELLREQNSKRMIDLIAATESEAEEKPIALENILVSLQELLVDLGLGKMWKDRSSGLQVVHNKLYGSLAKKKEAGNRNSKGTVHKS